MAIVRKFGKPDFFITITTKLNWREITKNLYSGQSSNDRHDLIARVFKHKSDALIHDLKENKIMGNVVYLQSTIEFQKRSLPHIHILVKVSKNDFRLTSDQVYECAKAEFLDKEKKPRLFEIVTKTMVHSRCDISKTKVPCWNEEKNICTKKLLEQYHKVTFITSKGKVIIKKSFDSLLDIIDRFDNKVNNNFCATYNLYLSLKYNSHINVKICESVLSSKYLFKYTHKSNGDNIAADVIETVESKDEVKLHIDGRYVGPSEAVWRIMKYPILYKDWTVVRLAVHLINEECTVADEINNGNNNCFKAEKDYKSILVAYYNLNKNDINSRKYLFNEILEHYWFDLKTREWKLRHRQRHTIGRIFTVSPMNVELFLLQQLLLHVPGAKFEGDLKIVNGFQWLSFRDAAIARGLLDTEDNYNELFQEACENRCLTCFVITLVS
uniref:Helitron_like_N domain-containing protein n=1 Tax=Strongyloides venezuelensis TaxID=75913 RepID=A0A0K0FGK5_STRVS